DRGVGINPGTTPLHDRNDQDPEHDAAEQNGENRHRRPDAPGLVEHVRFGLWLGMRHGGAHCTLWTIAPGDGSIRNCAIGKPQATTTSTSSSTFHKPKPLSAAGTRCGGCTASA